jgi:hypothetical protein
MKYARIFEVGTALVTVYVLEIIYAKRTLNNMFFLNIRQQYG